MQFYEVTAIKDHFKKGGSIVTNPDLTKASKIVHKPTRKLDEENDCEENQNYST